MKCIVIFGPSAVGKSTVGKKLADTLGYKLFHNHMVIELVHNFYTWNEKEFWPLVIEIRNRVFESVKNSEITGIVFTYVWALDQKDDHDELMNYMSSLGIGLDSMYFVELEAEQEIRLERNKDENRLIEKKTKRNISESEKFMYESEKKYKLNTRNDFVYPEIHLKINNSKLNIDETVNNIINRLNEVKFA